MNGPDQIMELTLSHRILSSSSSSSSLACEEPWLDINVQQTRLQYSNATASFPQKVLQKWQFGLGILFSAFTDAGEPCFASFSLWETGWVGHACILTWKATRIGTNPKGGVVSMPSHQVYLQSLNFQLIHRVSAALRTWIYQTDSSWTNRVSR